MAGKRDHLWPARGTICGKGDHLWQGGPFVARGPPIATAPQMVRETIYGCHTWSRGTTYGNKYCHMMVWGDLSSVWRTIGGMTDTILFNIHQTLDIRRWYILGE